MACVFQDFGIQSAVSQSREFMDHEYMFFAAVSGVLLPRRGISGVDIFSISEE
jgi:hypothetical protein